MTLINTRDCFVYDLICEVEELDMGPGRRKVLKKQYYFRTNNYPENYRQGAGLSKNFEINESSKLRVGVTCFENYFTNEEMIEMEKNIQITEQRSLRGNSFLLTF